MPGVGVVNCSVPVRYVLAYVDLVMNKKSGMNLALSAHTNTTSLFNIVGMHGLKITFY